jgi:hypothetical protein
MSLKYGIDRPYWVKFILSFLVAIILEPFRWIEHLLYDGRIRKFRIDEDPVFIVGHWRSGTTFLHNVLCKDPSAAYITTFQTIYPEMLFSGRKLIKSVMQAIMPKKRPFDNMDLGADFPQEGEFSITNTNGMGQSNFWHFPRQWRQIYKEFVEFEGMSPNRKKKWKNGYLRVIKKALMNTGGSRFISKNPPNTGRIDVLLEMFPNARFIHIYRDPLTTYVSSRHLVNTLMPVLSFQKFTEEELEADMLWQYRQIMQRFESQKHLIPEGNLVEVKYEEFEIDPVGQAQRIYKTLRLPGFESIRPMLDAYLESKRAYRKNKYDIDPGDVEKVKTHWGFAIERWGYHENLMN